MASNTKLYKGYRRRQDGSAFRGLGGQKMDRCPICGEPMQLAIGFERDWPKDPDLFVCPRCANLLIEQEMGPRLFVPHPEYAEYAIDDTEGGIGGFRTPSMDALDTVYDHMMEQEQKGLDDEINLLRTILTGSSVQFLEQGVLQTPEAQSFILLLSNAMNHLASIPHSRERYDKMAAMALQGAMMFQYCLSLLKKQGIELKMPEEMERILKEYDARKDAEIKYLEDQLRAYAEHEVKEQEDAAKANLRTDQSDVAHGETKKE